MLEIPMDNTTTAAPGWGRDYLLCAPDHFEVAYAINPWMDLAVEVDRGRARAQWDELVAALRGAGARVRTIDPADGLPDMVFTANAGLVVGDAFVPAAMRNPERRGEQAHFASWFAANGFSVQALGNGAVQEGAGDALPFGGRLVGGWRTRSSAEAYPELARLTGATPAAVELVDPRFYHLDLAFCPLGEGRAMVVPSALTEAGRAVISELVTEPLLLDAEEGAAFCANSVVVGSTVVMPACPPRVRRHLEEWGLNPVVVDVSEFQKAGGAVRCLTLALDVAPEHVGAPARADSEPRPTPIELAERHGAHNYNPLPVSIARAEGAWVWDADERPYLDALSAYSALNFGHRHPRLIEAARRQLDRVTLTSRAFHNDELGPFCRELAELCGKDRVLPMNTGAEAVETALKVARKWGRLVKGVPDGRAKVVVCDGNFHGRTITIVSFSDDPLARDDFGPFTPGFESVPFGDANALRAALEDDDVVAFLFEPVQGEAGVVIPPDGWLREVRALCTERGVLMMADEIQSGLGRTGRTFACDHEAVEPDVYVLGKALGGGIVPLSAVVAGHEVLGVLRPGEHGSTFGGNPLACAIGREVVRMIDTGEHQERSARLGERLLGTLVEADLALVAGVRGRGLWLGIDIVDGGPPARELCERLMRRGLLCKDTHESTVRLAPPLTIEERELDFMVDALRAELA
ncbi:MAG: ornithine--oxo-acid transaminase [Thermoleophilaceae bacterium]|nr:ornithine--oxo-acid transaminase [Thermoleophilaceae bacterium]